ncbi:hypothetical protein PWG71_10085 [Nocardiopsis sp. N85]|uniref:SCO7613 C-terminal domain-containing membrane protein n=1 Tax=Nocardiopsis sp. N85 TaxID=3029400 RepID=UPI00237F5B2A|nr:hypothetical protein [Nocardiopsis sp. N85]MDE3721737.1 hypothetical protein [Nocardiopsis sp. N85]
MNVPAPPPPSPGPHVLCPDCRSPLVPRARSCGRCGLVLVGSIAQRLWEVDTEIIRVDTLLGRLRGERAGLVRALREASIREAEPRVPSSAAVAVPPAASPVPASAAPMGPAPTPRPRVDGEMRRRSAQNVILGLGGLLIGISALVFAIWTWSDMGTGARALVLGLTTLGFAVVALPLHRRGLRATAETFGVLAAALMYIDALALWLLIPERIPNGAGYAAGALAIIAALMALYPLTVPLRAPRIVAVLSAQPVPLLVLFALPLEDPYPWITATLALVALADLLLVRLTGTGGGEVPRRTLYVLSVTLTVFCSGVAALAVFFVPASSSPPAWWGVTAALLVSGVGWLALSRVASPMRGDGSARVYPILGVATLALAPLAAGPAHLPALPRPPFSALWRQEGAMEPANRLLGLTEANTVWPTSLPFVAAILVAAALAAGVTALLRRDLLPPLLFLMAPPTLLAPPIMLSLPHPVVVGWALLLGAALVLGTAAVLFRPHAWVPATVGVATLITALLWACAMFWTFLASLVCVGLIGTAALLLLRHRLPGFGAFVPPAPGGRTPVPPGRALYGAGLALWAVGLVAWGSSWIAMSVQGTPEAGRWWLAAAVLVSGVTALLLGRPAPRSAPGGGNEARGAFTVFGLLLMPVAPLLIGPGGSALGLSGAEPVWGAPAAAMLVPAGEVMGVYVAAGPGTALGLAAGVLAAGAAGVGLVGLIDRRRTLSAAALVAPPALVPLPIILGAPFVVAMVWATAVGALLLLATALIRDRSAWVTGVIGAITLVAALAWSLPERHTMLIVVFLVAGTALACALLTRTRPGERTPMTAASGTSGLGAALAPGALAVFAWSLSLVATSVLGGDPSVWWMLAAIPLPLGAAALVLGERAWAGARAWTVLGLLWGALAPLVAGGSGAVALVPISWRYAVAEAPPRALVDPAFVFLGLSEPSGPASVVGVLAAGLLAVAATAMTARRWTGHTAALVAPPALVPLAILTGASFLMASVVSLLVGTALVLWSAWTRDRAFAWLPGLTGLLTLAQVLGWALAERHATIGVLLVVAVVGSVVAALARTPIPATAATAVATAATGGFAFTLTLVLGAPVEYAALVPIAVVAGVAAVAPRMRAPLVGAAEIPAALWAVVSVTVAVLYGAHGGIVALALAIVGVIALATAIRPGRRWAAAVGVLSMLSALWTALAAWNVTVPEAYTVLPALAALVIGWEWGRKAERAPSSWVSLSGGLCLLLLPGLGMVLAGEETPWRVPALLVAALFTALWGLRDRSQATLVIGGVTLVAASLRAFGPPLWDLTRLLPNWVPFAVIGALLLLIGARYEANLERVRRLGHFIGGMR